MSIIPRLVATGLSSFVHLLHIAYGKTAPITSMGSIREIFLEISLTPLPA
jgi:hypothetical protein